MSTMDNKAALAVPRPTLVNPIDLAAAHFGLQAVLALGHRFNLRRDINDVLNIAGRVLVWPTESLRHLQRFMIARCSDHPAWANVADATPEEFLQRFGCWNGVSDDGTIFYYLDEFAKQHSKELLAVFKLTETELTAELKNSPRLLLDNTHLLARVLGLSSVESKMIEFAGYARIHRDIRPLLVDCKVANAGEAYQLLADMSGEPVSEVTAALRSGGRLETLSLVDGAIAEFNVTDLSDVLRMSDRLLAVLLREYANERELLAQFARPAPETALSLADYPHVEADAQALTALLQGALKGSEKGINVLVYGPPGTGKSELARVIAHAVGSELFEVDCRDSEGASIAGRDRYRALQLAQVFLRGRSDTLLVFDEIEDVFPPASRELASLVAAEDTRHHSVSGKAWINQTLETNPIPTLWISNAIGQIDPAYLRRFQYHLELAAPPPQVREAMAQKHLAGMNVSAEFVRELATTPQLTPAQIRSAVRFAELAQGTMSDPVETLIRRQLKSANKALGRDAVKSPFRPLVTQYDLALLNIDSHYPVTKILTALAKQKRGTLCFYGLPGTGKTALAEHIAKTLDQPLMIRRASDLVSKFVGETEQQMAAMFAEAEAEKTVLLLDEADSFLQNRNLAQRNYEVSEVNEMLQGMERFNGIFICTTNLFDRIDEAALRRFTFKIKFLPLKAQNRESMFIAEALLGDAVRLTTQQQQRLSKLNLLTPGDFAAVRRQIAMFDETHDPDDFLSQLEAEHAVKPEIREARSIGFG